MSMPAALQSRRTYAGPPLFSYGFRPFFLVAALWAAFNILLWVPQYLGSITAATEFSALDWHIHEMLYGYVAAAIAGFLLTAIPNWTGRLPVNGWPLAGLVLLWLAGRAAILLSKDIGGFTAALVDASFLLALAIVAAREIIAGKNWRNLRVMIILAVLILGNIVFSSRSVAQRFSRLRRSHRYFCYRAADFPRWWSRGAELHQQLVGS
ncbi:MAG: NnrS family protein [Pseudolabrys sp.]